MDLVVRTLAALALAASIVQRVPDASFEQPFDPEGSALADTTLVDRVTAGRVLIRQLPETLAGETVSEYRGITVPVRGWLYGRSFFWRVPAGAAPEHLFAFEAVRPSGVDTVSLRVTVMPAIR